MPDLRSFLHRTFEKSGGEIPFENFMAMALYDPSFGYYSTEIENVGGERGDFATSATLSAALGRSIAKWLKEEREYHDWSGAFHVIEVGSGNGVLAREILKSFNWWKRREIHYHIVDVSAPLRQKQRAVLKGFKVSWHTKMEEALEDAGNKALIFSNELVDAFPAKRMIWSEIEGHWHEVFVAFDRKSGLNEVFRALPKGFPVDLYSAMNLSERPQGQRVEIQPLYQLWLAHAVQQWEQGSMLTIDYGGEAAEIYHRRPCGTARAYFQQQRLEGAEIYQRIGKQDLTVDVNFTDLMNWSEELELEKVGYEKQTEFLQRYGEGSDVMAGAGVGDAFQVLSQRRW
jgi:SAM-dependent MidA family methyltransferase